MGIAAFAHPLTPPHRRRWAGASDEPPEIETMTWPFEKRKDLLPKHLAERAKKLPADKVEAEVLRILDKPKPAPRADLPLTPEQYFAGMQQAAMQPMLQGVGQIVPLRDRRRDLERAALSQLRLG